MCKFNEIDGNASLQNSLELACDNFGALPSYGRKEVLIVFVLSVLMQFFPEKLTVKLRTQNLKN